MAVTEQVNRPAPFVEKLGTNLAENVLAQQGVPIVTGGIGSISQQPGEDAAAFKARQDAAQAFTTRQQSLAGLAPQVAGQDALQQQAQALAQQGIGSFQPFLDQAQTQAQVAAGLGTTALGQLGTAGTELTGAGTALAGAGTTLGTAGTELTGAGTALGTAGTTFGGVPLGAASSADIQQFMSPYQTQVIDASLAEFDRNKQIQEQQIRDQQAALGQLGAGRAGVQLAEFGTGSARERALLQAGLLQQGFGQAQAARQQDIQNRFGLGQAQAGLAGQQAGLAAQRAGLAGQQAGFAGQQAGFAGQRGALAGATQGLGAFQSALAGQQAQFGAQQQALQGQDISRLGSLGAINQAQAQANLDAQREAVRQAAFQPQEQLDRYASQVTGIMGGYPGQVATTNVPNPTPLQSALGIGTTLAGLYLGRPKGN
jgi:hypothetical protein